MRYMRPADCSSCRPIGLAIANRPNDLTVLNGSNAPVNFT